MKNIYQLSWYEYIVFRLGLFRFVCDFGSIIGLSFLYLCKPPLLFEFLSTWWQKKRIRYSTESPYHNFDLLELKKEEKNPVILIFVHGGSWGSGRLVQYLTPTKRIAQLIGASHAIALGYPVYPMGLMEDQVNSVRKGLDYIIRSSPLKNLFTNGKTPKIILCGHSSGAHISLLAIARYLQNNEKVPIDAYIGLSGPFDLVTHYEYKKASKSLGLTSMVPTANGPENLAQYSPALIIRDYLAMKKSDCTALPYIGLLQGLTDKVVPDYQSSNLQNMLEKDHNFQRSKCVLIKVLLLMITLSFLICNVLGLCSPHTDPRPPTAHRWHRPNQRWPR